MSETQSPFWADDFDMDLLKVFPNAGKMLANPGRVVYTVGNTSFGRLKHPAVWNSHGAFLWLTKPNLARDDHGWFNVMGCVSDSAEVECTWLEFLRDAWAHTYGVIILPSGRALPAKGYADFYAIMSSMRGWNACDIERPRTNALKWIMRCDAILESEAPYE